MKKSWQKVVSGFAIVVVLGLVLTGCGNKSSNSSDNNESTVAKIQKRGTIRIAVFGDLPPYG